MALSTSLRKTASKLVGRFGGLAIIRTTSSVTYNTATGAASETTTETSVRGVLESVNLREVNDLIQATDKKLLIAAADFGTVPTADEVIITGTTYQVVRVFTIEQDNTAITHELILRA